MLDDLLFIVTHRLYFYAISPFHPMSVEGFTKLRVQEHTKYTDHYSLQDKSKTFEGHWSSSHSGSTNSLKPCQTELVNYGQVEFRGKSQRAQYKQ